MVVLDEEQEHVIEVLEEEIDHEVPREGLAPQEDFGVFAELVGFGVLGEVGG